MLSLSTIHHSIPLLFTFSDVLNSHFQIPKTLLPETPDYENEARYRTTRIVPPYESYISCSVRSEDMGKNILDTLYQRFPFRPYNEWQTRLINGWVKQGSLTLSPDSTLLKQDPLTLYYPNRIEPAVPDDVSILSETNDYYLIYKPAPMPIHPGGRYYKNTLTYILKEKTDDKPFFLIHRLDSVTSGLLLVAKNRDFLKAAHQAFASRHVEKNYLAVVNGHPKEEFATINKPIRRKTGYLFECENEGSEALTHFRVLAFKHGRSLINCSPETGRTHQIRLHLKEWGYPIYDDLSYLPSSKNKQEKQTGFQNRSISLLHYRLSIPALSLDCNLFDYLQQT